MSIFKAYDIRGIYPTEINEVISKRIGESIATFLKVKTIAVGRDMRISGKQLFKALCKGLVGQGINVIDVGLVSSPMIYFSCNFLGVEASVMVTASHNPKEYNGFKLTREKAIPISGDTGIKEIEKIYSLNKPIKKQKGSIIRKDIKQDYKKHVLKFANYIKPLKIVIDTANGMGGLEISLIEKDLPLTIIPLYFDLDGTFPNHPADPLNENNLKDLIKSVKENKADLGIAFDGDADRVFFVTEEGERVPADFITCLVAEDYLKEFPLSKVLYDIRSSWVVRETIEKNNGIPSMSKVGHAFIKAQLRKEDAIFAGELSGHFYYKENFYTDSGIITALKILRKISKDNKKLSDLISPLKKYFATGELNSEVKDKDKILEKLEINYKDGKVSHLDGLYVEYKDWWFNVRASNTEPLLRLNLEAKTKGLMEKKKEEILRIIRG